MTEFLLGLKTASQVGWGHHGVATRPAPRRAALFHWFSSSSSPSSSSFFLSFFLSFWSIKKWINFFLFCFFDFLFERNLWASVTPYTHTHTHTHTLMHIHLQKTRGENWFLFSYLGFFLLGGKRPANRWRIVRLARPSAAPTQFNRR